MVTPKRLFLAVQFDDGSEHLVTADPEALTDGSAFAFLDDLEERAGCKVRALIPSPMPPLKRKKENGDA